MDPKSIIILPFGILPLVLLAGYIVWKMLVATGQRTITNDRRFGTTEFPTVAAALLCGTNKNELSFSEDGQSVILTVARAYMELPDIASATEYVRENLWDREEVTRELAEQLQVTHVERTAAGEDGRGYKLTLALPREVVLSRAYIESEILNVGRVFLRNLNNEHRFLLPTQQQERHLEVRDGKMIARIGRGQLVPTMLAKWGDGVMSERQITRNIKNRLWNLVDVRCLSIDGSTYVGEITVPGR